MKIPAMFIEEIVSIPGLRNVTFTDAPGYSRSFDMRWELRRRTAAVPITILWEKKEFLEAIDAGTLPGNVRYMFSAESQQEAAVIMK